MRASRMSCTSTTRVGAAVARRPRLREPRRGRGGKAAAAALTAVTARSLLPRAGGGERGSAGRPGSRSSVPDGSSGSPGPSRRSGPRAGCTGLQAGDPGRPRPSPAGGRRRQKTVSNCLGHSPKSRPCQKTKPTPNQSSVGPFPALPTCLP